MKTRLNQTRDAEPISSKNKSKPVIKESPEDQTDKYSGSMLNQKTYEDFNKERPDPESEKPAARKKTETRGLTENSLISKTKKKEESEAKTYTCSMHPAVTADKPGKCPTCGMALVQRISSK